MFIWGMFLFSVSYNDFLKSFPPHVSLWNKGHHMFECFFMTDLGV
jgi:hypothetical protein